jgi:hypothetical protein
MNYTRPPEFPTLKQFLREDEDDIFAGVRGVIQDIRNAWTGGSRQKVERSRASAYKKLDDSGKAKLSKVINVFILSMLENLNAKPNFGTVTNVLNSRQEAEVAGLVFVDLANPVAPEQCKLYDMARNFLHYAVIDGVITQDRSELLLKQVIAPTDRGVGPDVVTLFNQNAEFFKRVFALDQELMMHPNDGANLLHKKLGGTESQGTDTKEKAVLYVISGIQRMRMVFLQIIDAIKATGAKRPATPDDEKKLGGMVAPAHPAAKKPVSTPSGASMQAQADANQAAAKDAGTAMTPTAPAAPAAPVSGAPGSTMNPQQELEDTVSALVKLGYDTGVAKRLAGRVPKGTKADDAVQMILKGKAGR